MVFLFDSIRDVLSDKFALVKLIAWATPFMVAFPLLGSRDADIAYSIILIWGVVLLALAIDMIKRFFAGEEILLPSLLNPAPIVWSFLQAILAILPSIGITLAIFWSISGFVFNFAESTGNIYLPTIIFSLLGLIFIPFILLSGLNFAENNSVLKAYDIRYVVKNLAEMIVGTLFCVVQILIMNIVLIFVPKMAIYMVWGDGSFVWTLWLSFSVVLNVFVIAVCLGMLKREIRLA